MARIRICILGAALVSGALTLPPRSAAAADEYVVRPGDSLFAIASQLDVSLGSLLRSNGLQLQSVIVPGQRLTVPGTTGPSSGAAGGSYTVQDGDWLARIATRHGVSLPALLAANGLRATSVILPGQRLIIPAAGSAPASAPDRSASAGSYVVRRGDWLARIASRHGVSLSALLAANGLAATSVIVPGQRLVIPAASAAQGSGAIPSAAAGRYTVVRGDTLGGIAGRHGVSLAALLAANGLSATSLILPGRLLTIPAPSASGSVSDAGSRAAASRIDAAVNYALAQVGKAYRFAGRGPYAFDCSGLTLSAYARAGVSLVHYSAAQARQGRAVDFWNSPIRRGDLVFMDTDGDGVINHVGIAISATSWVQAREARRGVTVGPLPAKGDIVAVRRPIP